jgi:hypothetical protein
LHVVAREWSWHNLSWLGLGPGLRHKKPWDDPEAQNPRLLPSLSKTQSWLLLPTVIHCHCLKTPAEGLE